MSIRKSLLTATLLVLTILAPPAGSAAEGAPDLSLPESIELAVRQSLQLHSAREGIRGAEARQKEAFTAFLPTLSTSYGFTRLNEPPHIVFPGFPPFIQPGEITTGTKENYKWALEARQPLFAGGGIVANFEASRLGTEVARLEEAAALQELAQAVKIGYFNILKAQRILVVARQSLDRLKAHRDDAQSFYDAGVIAKNDLLSAEVELANGRQFLVRSENGVEMAKARFNTLLRREIGAPLEVRDILDDAPFGQTLEGCVAAAMENRPEIRGQALRLEQAGKLVSLAKSEYYPSVGLVGNYSRFGDTPGVAGSPYQDQETWYVAAQATWNFWEWGKTGNRVDAGLSRQSQASDALADIREQITLEVKNGYLQMGEAAEQVRVSKKAIEQAEENFRINTERYREQVGRSTDVIDAQTLLTRARSDYDNALGDFNISKARLERATGSFRR